jgi:hypothetical protein
MKRRASRFAPSIAKKDAKATKKGSLVCSPKLEKKTWCGIEIGSLCDGGIVVLTRGGRHGRENAEQKWNEGSPSSIFPD